MAEKDAHSRCPREPRFPPPKDGLQITCPTKGRPEASCLPETVALTVYVLYLLAPFLFLATALFGIVLAYSFQDRGAAWVRSHFRYQISLFWRGFRHTAAILAVGIVGTVVFVFSRNVNTYANLIEAFFDAVRLYGGFALFLLFSLVCALCLDIARAALGLRAWNLRQPIAFGPSARARKRATAREKREFSGKENDRASEWASALDKLETFGMLLFVLFAAFFLFG